MNQLVNSSAVSDDKACAYFIEDASFIFTRIPCSVKGHEEILDSYSQKKLSGVQRISLNPSVFISSLDQEKGLDRNEHIRLSAFRLLSALETHSISAVQIPADEITPEEFRALSMGFYYGAYDFSSYKSKQEKRKLPTVEFLVDTTFLHNAEEILQETSKVNAALTLARNLINTPGSDLVPEHFVEIAQSQAKAYGLNIHVRDMDTLINEGYMGIPTVGKGSPNKPYMVTLEYTPKNAATSNKLGIVGKGVTFDTGGISLKPSASMWEMRMDMGGAATTLAAITAIAALELPIPVVAVLCLAENRPDGQAVLPGDIFTAKNGKTVQVENTDAEGRLVLSDGLYEAGEHGVTHLIDIATLTGAVVRAIGDSLTGLFSNEEGFAENIAQCGIRHGEKFWPLPLEMEYHSTLEDKVADLKNIGEGVGAITAALFLQEFVPENTIWAHWDIAGTAFHTKAWKYIPFGASGWGVQSLIELANQLGKEN
jgi:leucyl aminopeptidase